ncbi:hypothetical protein HanPI659440_Chr06g0248281 [Helianthus annuus]|nr:hypothetical protein HanPI659440_Chr06g0248281 [Helianthus annuus]
MVDGVPVRFWFGSSFVSFRFGSVNEVSHSQKWSTPDQLGSSWSTVKADQDGQIWVRLGKPGQLGSTRSTRFNLVNPVDSVNPVNKATRDFVKDLRREIRF